MTLSDFHAFRTLFSERLNALLDRCGAPARGQGRTKHVAEMFGVSLSGANKWLHGDGLPELDRLPEMCRLLDANYADLLPPLPAGQIERDVDTVWKNATLHAFTNLLREDEDQYRSYQLLHFSCDRLKEDTLYLWTVEDDSMAALCIPGDAVFVRHAQQVRHNGLYLFRVFSSFLFRRVALRTDGATMDLIPENDRYPTESLPAPSGNDDCRVIGRVLARVLVQR